MSQISRTLKRLKRALNPNTSAFRVWLDGRLEDLDIYYEIHIYRPIRGFFYDIYYGFRNLWEYKGLIWRDRDWDHVYLYAMLEFKLRRIGKLMIDHGSAVTSKRYGMKALIAAECAKRLNDDFHSKYWDKVNHKIPSKILPSEVKWIRLAAKEEEIHRKFYIQYLFKLMKKYSEVWWD